MRESWRRLARPRRVSCEPDLDRQTASLSLAQVQLLLHDSHGWQNQGTDFFLVRSSSALWLCHPCE